MAINFESDLLQFTGRECVHCHEMDPLVDAVQDELGVKIQQFEVWHNEENNKLWKSLDKGFCNGVPFFYNRKTGKWICGEANYDKLKDWATGK